MSTFTSADKNVGSPLLYKVLTEISSPVPSPPVCHDHCHKLLRLGPLPPHIASNPRLKEALYEIMNADYDSLLTIVQYLQKYVEFHCKKLRSTSESETENVLTNHCTDMQPSCAEMSNENSVLNSIPLLCNRLTKSGSDCARNWVPDDGLCQSPNVPNGSPYFSSIVDDRIITPETVDPTYLSSNIEIKQEVTYEDVPFSAMNPQLSTLPANIKREKEEMIEHSTVDVNDIVMYMNRDTNNLSGTPEDYSFEQDPSETVKLRKSKDNIRKQRCKKCDGCVRPDCGECSNCLDMKKFGGPGRKRRCCVTRQCTSVVKVRSELKLESDVTLADAWDDVQLETDDGNSVPPKVGIFLLTSKKEEAKCEMQVTLEDAWDDVPLGDDGDHLVSPNTTKYVSTNKGGKRRRQKR